RPELNVLEQRVEPRAGPRVAYVFFHLLEAADLHLRSPLGLFGWDAFADFLLGEELHIGAQFVVQGLLRLAGRKKAAPETLELAERQGGSSLPGLDRFEGSGDRERDAAPALCFDFQLTAAGLGEAIVLGATLVFG